MAEAEVQGMVEPAGRRRQSEQYWRGQVEAWRGSGLTQSEYCRRGGVHWYGFRYWKSKVDFELCGGPAAGGKLVAVKVRAEGRAASGEIRIRVAGRYVVEVSAGFDGSLLGQVMDLLERR